MRMPGSIRIVVSGAAELRVREARSFVESHFTQRDATEATGIAIVGGSRGAADDLARAVASSAPATVGLHRLSFTQLAARLATPVLAADGRAPVSYLGSEAVAARATFERAQARCPYFRSGRTDTRLSPGARAHVSGAAARAGEPGSLEHLPLGGRDLSSLLARFDEQFAAASATDRATLFEAATHGIQSAREPAAFDAVVLLDVPCDSSVEFDFLRALISARATRADHRAARRSAALDAVARSMSPPNGWSSRQPPISSR